MYTMETTIGECLDIPAVKEFIGKVAPQMLQGPALDYMTPLSLAMIGQIKPEMAPLAAAICDVANGKEPHFEIVDPKTQKPKVGPVIYAGYNIDDVDGKVYMLEHAFSGCVLIQFSKEIDESIPGKILYEGKELPYIIKKIAILGDQQKAGIFVREICTEYDKEYTLNISDFVDTDGNMMDPAEYTFTTAPKGEVDPAYAAHDAIALQAAEEGIVLLKNANHTLPLAKDARVALENAVSFRMGAVGAGKINPRYAKRLGIAMEESDFVIDDNASTGIVVISRASGENFDNGAFEGQYYLTSEEKQMLADARKKYASLIVIVNSGYPMDVRFIEEYAIDAAIWCGYPGMLGGEAIVNILNGSVCPSGRLADTWSLDYYDIPSSKNFYMPPTPEEALDADHDVWVDTVYEEDIYVGYRYFDTFGKDVAYPFGYGLSYTTFASECKTAAFAPEGEISVTVTNTGDTAGKEVVQIYASVPDGELEQPSKILVAFGKTDLLAPGASETLTLSVSPERFASYDEKTSSFIMEAGEYKLFLGANVNEVTEIGSFHIAETVTVKEVGNYMAPPIDFKRLSKKDPDSYPKGELSGIVEGVHELPNRTGRQSIPDSVELKGGLFDDVDDWSIEELARFSVCASSGWGMQDVGVAGRVSQLPGRDIPYYAVADGNNGVNINKPNIGMPTSNLVCSTWNADLAYTVGQVIAEEAAENNVQMILAPAMNIHRNPLCGRQPEYFSEDPLLTGIMAGNQCKGLEDAGVASSVKHVCCNGAESTRKRNHSIVSQRALRDIYLRAFAVAFEVKKPSSIMTSYNACNGVFTAEDEELLQGIFRQELGLEGYIMTDWNSYDTADIATSTQAGLCWFTPGTTDSQYTTPIVEGVKNGTISEDRLRQNVKYMYRVIKNGTI